MPGALTTLLANNAAHMIPGGRRRKMTRRHRGGTSIPSRERAKEGAEDLMNQYGCKRKYTFANAHACLVKMDSKAEEYAKDPNLADDLRRLKSDIRALETFHYFLQQPRGGSTKKTRRATA